VNLGNNPKIGYDNEYEKRSNFSSTSITCIHQSGSYHSNKFDMVYNTCNCKDGLSMKFLRD